MGYAQITLAISDGCPGGLEGFAPLSDRLPASVFADAIEDGQATDRPGAFYNIFADLMEIDHTQVDEKCISLEQAAKILGVAEEDVIPIGRQRLAQINDEAAADLAARVHRRTPPSPRTTP